MHRPEDFEIDGEALAVTLPADRGVRVSVHLTEAETEALLALAEQRGLPMADAARAVLLAAIAPYRTPGHRAARARGR